MLFGLSSSPSNFARFVNKMFNKLVKEDKVLIYFDDILIATSTVTENFKRSIIALSTLTFGFCKFRTRQTS